MTCDPATLLVAAAAGVVGGSFGPKVLSYLLGEKRAHGQAVASEPNAPMYYCDFHEMPFYEQRDARRHAIEAHNAPREQWEATFTGGRREDEP